MGPSIADAFRSTLSCTKNHFVVLRLALVGLRGNKGQTRAPVPKQPHFNDDCSLFVAARLARLPVDDSLGSTGNDFIAAFVRVKHRLGDWYGSRCGVARGKRAVGFASIVVVRRTGRTSR